MARRQQRAGPSIAGLSKGGLLTVVLNSQSTKDREVERKPFMVVLMGSVQVLVPVCSPHKETFHRIQKRH